MASRVFLSQLALALLTLSAVVLSAGLLVGHWGVLGAIGVCALPVVGALAAPLTKWALGPGRAFAEAIRQLQRGDIERLAVYQVPAELRDLLESVHDLATARQRNAFFLADVAHQLRTELQLLQIRLEGLDGHVGEPGKRLYARTMADAERLHGTLTEQLEIARLIEASPPTEVDMCEVVLERVGAWTDVAERHVMRIRTLLEGEPVILSRHGMLEQVLDILLDNAVRHSPAGGTITVLVEVGRCETTLRVIDEGLGMTAEERGCATLRGWRGDHARGDGRGVGLSIVAMLVGSNGGRLALEEAPGGRGVDARCSFPLINADVGALDGQEGVPRAGR
ncbi:sensor histidine kinase [Streptomyces sp. NPDC059063]|uniref:sensor histidine kinase n=1 Tax=unclassified Streptomyces TaxID=2593676 RepID=UPI0036B31A22